MVEPCDLSGTPGRVGLTALQAEGAAQAAAIVDRYGGVIVADSVGMGKTYIALRLIECAVAARTPVVIVIPATLRTKWHAALRAADLERAPPVVTVVTHTLVRRLARTTADALVVVDEAHQFRNPRTARYRALAMVCAHARVVLLTATPINNRPADLYWLLRLFLGDGALHDAGVPDLRAALRERDAAVHFDLARRVVSHVMVRRTRTDLLDTECTSTAGSVMADSFTPHSLLSHDARGRGPSQLRFPHRHAPRAVPYDLRAACPALIDGLEDAFASLRLSAFDLSLCTTGMATRDVNGTNGSPALRLDSPIHGRPASRATGSLIRIGLLKRLESSTEAFRSSLVRLLRFLDAFDEAVACGGYLRARDSRASDPLQFSLTALLAQPLPRTVDRVQLAIDVAADRDVLRRMLQAVPANGIGAKTAALARLLGSLDDVPRVVFTEFADTAEALFATLPRDGTALLHGARAALASGPVSRRAVLERFAPAACGVRPPARHERIHTLIATDVLAEGLDLQDARHCISFDLPWNPVRLMQRAGRIDRLGSPHDDVFVWYFEPTAELERLLGLMRRLGAKVRTIEQTVGVEHAVFGVTDADDAASDTRAADDDVRASRDALRALVTRSPHAAASARNVADRIGASSSDIARHARSARTIAPTIAATITPTIAARASLAAVDSPTLLLARRVGSSTWVEGVRLVPGAPEQLESAEITRLLVALHAAMGTAKATRRSTGRSATDAALGRRAIAEALHTYRAWTAERPCDGTAIVQQTAVRLRYALARLPGTPAASLCRRADRILRQLRRGLRAGAGRSVRNALRAHEGSDAGALCDALESALAGRSGGTGRQSIRTVAVLLLEPAVTAEIARNDPPASTPSTSAGPPFSG